MTLKIKILFILFSLLISYFIFECSRRRKIRLKYTFFWVLMCFALLFFSFFTPLLDKLAAFIGIHETTNAIFVVLIVCILALLLDITLIVSDLFYENKKRVLKSGLLEWKLEQLEKKHGTCIWK